MDKGIYSDHQFALQKLLRDLRVGAGLTQQDVASKIDEPQSFVSKYEMGERRLDILELRQLCVVLELTLPEFAKLLEERIGES